MTKKKNTPMMQKRSDRVADRRPSSLVRSEGSQNPHKGTSDILESDYSSTQPKGAEGNFDDPDNRRFAARDPGREFRTEESGRYANAGSSTSRSTAAQAPKKTAPKSAGKKPGGRSKAAL